MPLNNFRKSRVVVNGVVNSSGTVTRSVGYVNWIADHLRKNFRSPSKITTELKKSNVQLTYSLGGYSTKRYLTVLGEQSSPTATISGILIPEDDYDVFLHKSQPIAQIVYSAVVVKKTNLGYSVSGYNIARPYFTIIPSQTSNNNYVISVNGVGSTVYKDFENFTVDVTYGTEFTSIQQVVDFLVSYQRYLESVGVLFIDNSSVMKEPMNFVLSAKEFITWHQQGWRENNLIVLGPIADTLKVNLPSGTTDRIQNSKLHSCVLDQNYNIVANKELDINRYDNFTSVYCKRITTIGLAVLDVVEYEHQLVFKNKTQFNDIIYQPELGNRQSRLKISGSKTDNWAGTLDAPGFVITVDTVADWDPDQVYSVGDIVKYKIFYYVALEGNTSITFNTSYWQQIDYNQVNQTLLPNLTTIATMSRDYYDVNGINLNESIDDHARGLIGFRSRNYFSDLGVDAVSQTKFYQGFIKNKGAPTALLALQNANFGKLTNTVDIYEDWAFRVGEYGSIDADQFIEINLQEKYFSLNPGVGVISSQLGTDSVGSQLITTDGFYKKPSDFVGFAQGRPPYREDNILVAGYVDPADVDATIFDIQNLASSDLLVDIYPGYVVWCALDYTRNWNVFRVVDTGLAFKEVSNLLDQRLMIEFKDIHLLSVDDVVAVKNFSQLIDGFYRVESIPEIDAIVVTSVKSLLGFTSTTGDGVFYKLTSLRFSSIEDSVKFNPQNNWRENEKIWIDNYEAEGKWAVLEKRSTWSTSTESLYSTAPLLTGFGVSLAAESSGTYVAAGSTGRKVFVYKKNSAGNYNIIQTIANTYTGIVNFGSIVDLRDSTMVVGDVGFAGTGAIIIYQKNSADQFEPAQFIAPILSNNARFGFSFVLSKNFLVVGAPGINTIYIYEKRSQSTYSFRVASPQAKITIGSTIASVDSIIIVTDLGVIVPQRDYSISVSTITFSRVPATGFTIYQRSYYYNLFQTINDKSISGLTDFFGYSVEINAAEDKIYVGAPYADIKNVQTQQDINNAGRVIAYYLRGGSFQFMQRIEPAVLEINGEFGSAIKSSNNDTALFVGSPGVSFPSTYSSGQAYRFVNLGQVVGTTTTAKFNGSLSSAGTIIINGVNVPLSGNINNIKSQIDAAAIPYISTNIVDQVLTISSSSIVEFDKLSVLPGFGTVFSDLGLKFFTESQIIPNPIDRNLSRFGEELDLSDNNNQLFVSSPNATSILETVFDDTTCYFDSTATIFQDQQINSGSVCVFEFIKPRVPTTSNLGSYIFGQQLQAITTSTGDQFGSSLSVAGNTIFVGAPGDDVLYGTDNRGRIDIFKSLGTASMWNQIKLGLPLVDVDSIDRAFLYNKKTNTISTTLDIVDPIKGRILGIARQYIDYIESQDPADYNRSSGLDTLGVARVDDANYWTNQYVGRYWLDTSQIKFIDYEQQDLIYRRANWNRLFDGSEVRVYQWVESDVLPSTYQKFYAGTPRYLDDESYVVSYDTDKNTGAIKVKYYFWVRNYDVQPISKDMSTTAIEEYITNPKSSGLPYIVFYSPTAFGIYNGDQYIDGENTILHIDYSLTRNDNIIHSEYELVQEHSRTSNPPSRILKKFIDSLAGLNAIKDLVPEQDSQGNHLLKVSERYGLGIRPRQTLLVDRLAALEVFVSQANLKLKNLFTADRIIGSDLFYKNDTQDSTDFWRYTAWVAEGFDPATPVQFTVAKFADLKKINYAVGTIVKVTNDNERYVIVKITADGFDLQLQEGGTIELLPIIYQTTTPSLAIRKVLEGLFYQLWVEDYAIYANELFFILVKYSLREQKYLDWAFKTSFLVVDHDITQFEQWPNYQPDNTTYFIDYINEAKPYHTKIREYRPRYTGITQAGVTATDFDLPSYYDEERQAFKTPSGEAPGDALLWQTRLQYQDWYNNYKLHLDSVSIGSGGTGYLTAPTITITGGGGTGATARAILTVGAITGIVVTNPGKNYTSTPTITVTRSASALRLNTILVAQALTDKISGRPIDTILDAAFNSVGLTADDLALVLKFNKNSLTGFALATVTNKLTSIQNFVIARNGTNSLNVDAVLYANMDNNTTRKFNITLLFDRVSYSATYSGIGFDVNLFDDDNFDDGDPARYFETAFDRVRKYYKPRPGQPGIDYGQLFSGVDFPGYDMHGLDYAAGAGYDSSSYADAGYAATGDQSRLFDMVLNSNYQDLLLGTRAEDITFDGGKFVDPAHSHAPEELVPGIVFDTLDIKVFHKFAGSSTPNVTFRMFKDLVDQYSYYRMSSSNTTILSQPLLITDTEIAVVSAAVLDEPSGIDVKPGVVFINGERITYYERDIVNNRLRRIRRGTAGTGAPEEHPAGTSVVGSGYSQLIEYSAHTTVWYDPTTGLENSGSNIAKFLKDKPPVSVT